MTVGSFQMWLFHGAHEDVLDTIAEEGFDFRVSRSGSLLGHGCYFSVSRYCETSVCT
jgi:hypothetical protein